MTLFVSLSLALYPSSTFVIVSREATILGLSSNTTILVKTPCHSQWWSTILILPGTRIRSRRLCARDAWPPSELQLQVTFSVEHLEPILQCNADNAILGFPSMHSLLVAEKLQEKRLNYAWKLFMYDMQINILNEMQPIFDTSEKPPRSKVFTILLLVIFIHSSTRIVFIL